MDEPDRPPETRWLHTTLTALALASLCAFWLYFHLAPPRTGYGLYNFDPETAYMVTSLAPFAGLRYAFVDHPGTPVEVLGTMLLAFTYPIAGGDGSGFVEFHMRHPSVFVVMAHATVLLLHLLAVWMLARRALTGGHWTDALLAVSVAVSFHALSPAGPFSTLYWSHNAFAFPAATALLLGLRSLLRRPPDCPPRHALGLGLLAGAVAAIQLLFAGWVIGVMVALAAAQYWSGRRLWPALKPAGAVLAGAALGFFVATLPTVHLQRQFWRWVAQILIHQGAYGGGEAGLPPLGTWLANLRSTWEAGPWLLVALAVLLLAGLIAAPLLDRRPRTERIPSRAMTLGVCAQIGLTLLLTLKHPNIFYLWILGAGLPFLLWAVADCLPQRRWWKLALALLIFGQLGANLVAAVESHRLRLAHRQELHDALNRYLGRDGHSPNMLYWTYGFADPTCYPLWFGNDFVERRFRTAVAKVCPADGFLHLWSNTLFAPSSDAPLGKEASGTIVTTANALRGHPALADYGTPFEIGVKDPFYGAVLLIPLARPAGAE